MHFQANVFSTHITIAATCVNLKALWGLLWIFSIHAIEWNATWKESLIIRMQYCRQQLVWGKYKELRTKVNSAIRLLQNCRESCSSHLRRINYFLILPQYLLYLTVPICLCYCFKSSVDEKYDFDVLFIDHRLSASHLVWFLERIIEASKCESRLLQRRKKDMLIWFRVSFAVWSCQY